VETNRPESLINEYLYGRPFYPATPLSWLAPFWSFLCGAAASAGWAWTGSHLLRLLLGLLLVGPLLGLAWAASARTRWQGEAIDDPPDPMAQPSLVALPYTLPGSASQRLAEKWSMARGWWQQVEPRLGKPLVQLVGSTIFALTVAAQLGRQSLALGLLVLTVAHVGGLGRTRWTSAPIVSVSFPLLTAWLLGHAAYDALNPASAFAGVCFALVFYGASVLKDSSEPNAVGLAWQLLPWAAATVTLIAIKQPLIAATVALLGTSQLLLLPLLEREGGHALYFRALQFQLAISMFLAASALGYTP
jgi:hypothetical protein